MELWIMQHITLLVSGFCMIAAMALSIAYYVYMERLEKTNTALTHARYVCEENARRDEQMSVHGTWWPESYGPHYRPGASCSGPALGYGFERGGW